MKKKDASLKTQDLKKLVDLTGNVYKSVVMISKRALQVAVKTKSELNEKLEEFAVQTDDLEEFSENKEHIEISKFYEKQPKPVVVATQEFLAGKLIAIS